jgi:putative protease
MCYSGQCFLSSVIGGRSGNRGLCAQPCRLRYGWGASADSYPLSLKDMSLASHLRQLRRMGVACVKIEGRMKRPEYVAVVTGIYARLLREDREPTPEELRQLQEAFSRQGFTDGYYVNHTGPAMFGVREKQPEPKELFAQAKAAYSRENPRVDVTLYAMLLPGESAKVGVEDDQGRVATAEGPVPEAARTRALTKDEVAAQLAKTGGTPFVCRQAKVHVAPGLSLPLSALNALRRQVLEELAAQRSAPPARRKQPFQPGVRYEERRTPPGLTISLSRAEQLSRELLSAKPALLYLPVAEAVAHPDAVELCRARGVPVAVSLPRILWDNERPQLKKDLDAARAMGITEALVGTLGLVRPAWDAGMLVRGDFGLGAYNSQTLKELKRLGFRSATASFELRLSQIRDLSKALDLELIVYGRLPLMITENCIIEQRSGRCGCENSNILTDRTGARFPVVKAPGCRNEILNSKKLFLADKREDYQRLGLWAARLQFTTENAVECAQAAQRYLGKGAWTPGEYTRGLYYREVE